MPQGAAPCCRRAPLCSPRACAPPAPVLPGASCTPRRRPRPPLCRLSSPDSRQPRRMRDRAFLQLQVRQRRQHLLQHRQQHLLVVKLLPDRRLGLQQRRRRRGPPVLLHRLQRSVVLPGQRQVPAAHDGQRIQPGVRTGRLPPADGQSR